MRKRAVMAVTTQANIELLPNGGDGDEMRVVPHWHSLDDFALASDGVDGIDIESLESGTVLDVETRNSHYRIVVLDGPNRLVLLQGGKMFPETTLVRLSGATAGGSALKTGWIIPGLKIEVSHGRRRISSSVVRSATISSIPPSPRGDDCPA
jgi:hypothetical protein